MPRKKRETTGSPKTEPEETANLMMVTEEPVETVEEPVKEPETPDVVTVEVLVGTLVWEGGWFSKGDTFTCTRERAARFESTDAKIVESAPEHRPTILAVKRLYGDSLICGAEIGVYKAENAVDILNLLNIEKLHLIDPYKRYMDGRWVTDFSYAKQDALEATESYKDKVVWHLTSSDEAAETIEDESLEFVYVDGNHSVTNVERDIKNYLPKIKDGGILGGHDYCKLSPGVIEAVDKFVAESGFKLNVEFAGHHLGAEMYDWYVQKTVAVD